MLVMSKVRSCLVKMHVKGCGFAGPAQVPALPPLGGAHFRPTSLTLHLLLFLHLFELQCWLQHQ